MKILNPKTGQVEDAARFAEGQLYSKDCADCGAHVGGCIVGGESPLPTNERPCSFCGTGRVILVPATAN